MVYINAAALLSLLEKYLTSNVFSDFYSYLEANDFIF